MHTYTVTVEFLPHGRTVVRVPLVDLPRLNPVFDEAEPVEFNTTVVDVPIHPWVTDAGTTGYAGWALVGTTLRGFVLDGPGARLVQADLTARLDRLLVALKSGGEAGVDFVRAAERGDRSEGEKRAKAIVRGMLARMSKS